ncbi:hypothetical protein SASPL_117582 [Salvia splendens]|uniref:Uncharacterized protein n=1 Tax=Salvia splendens TaxID=180675 RepID=A0A8X8ZXW7_SALSN|nr:hypothetical protein SASPL_117582 [Salvia splendens]
MVTPFVPSPGLDRVCHGLGYKFELMTNSGLATGIPIAQGRLSVRKGGGSFCIESMRKEASIRGFVMGSSVQGEGKTRKPLVQVNVHHVARAAIFVALAAAGRNSATTINNCEEHNVYFYY